MAALGRPGPLLPTPTREAGLWALDLGWAEPTGEPLSGPGTPPPPSTGSSPSHTPVAHPPAIKSSSDTQLTTEPPWPGADCVMVAWRRTDRSKGTGRRHHHLGGPELRLSLPTPSEDMPGTPTTHLTSASSRPARRQHHLPLFLGPVSSSDPAPHPHQPPPAPPLLIAVTSHGVAAAIDGL